MGPQTLPSNPTLFLQWIHSSYFLHFLLFPFKPPTPFPSSLSSAKSLASYFSKVRKGRSPSSRHCLPSPRPRIVFPRSVITSAASFSQWHWTPLLTSQKSSLLQFSLSLLCHHFFFPNQQANTLWYLNSKYINKWKLTLNSPITLPFQLLLLSSIFLYSKFPLQKFLYVLSPPLLSPSAAAAAGWTVTSTLPDPVFNS